MIQKYIYHFYSKPFYKKIIVMIFLVLIEKYPFFLDLLFYSVLNSRKLDGVGPVDNRPSTDKLHHCVKNKNKNKQKTKCDTLNMTPDTWHLTWDM